MDSSVSPEASSSTSAAVRVDGGRLWRSLMSLAQIGATPKGGVCRIALTDEDKLGRDQVAAWCREAGLEVLGISLVTNLAAGISPTPLHHAEVLEAGAEAAPRLRVLLAGIADAL